jgi:hypothetical protein
MLYQTNSSILCADCLRTWYVCNKQDWAYISRTRVTPLEYAPFVMGQIQSADESRRTEGHWASDWKTGYRWCTDSITSGPEVTKESGAFGETWGPYEKWYTKTIFGQWLFTPPEKVDDVPILCRCRDIRQYMRDREGRLMTGAQGAMLLGGQPPACWEDDSNLWEPMGGPTFRVHVRHPDFYSYFLSSQGSVGLVSLVLAPRARKSSRKNLNGTRRRSRRRP